MLPPCGRHRASAFLEPSSSYRVWESWSGDWRLIGDASLSKISKERRPEHPDTDVSQSIVDQGFPEMSPFRSYPTPGQRLTASPALLVHVNSRGILARQERPLGTSHPPPGAGAPTLAPCSSLAVAARAWLKTPVTCRCLYSSNPARPRAVAVDRDHRWRSSKSCCRSRSPAPPGPWPRRDPPAGRRSNRG